MTISIADTINNHEYVVDQWLIDALKAEWNKGTYSSEENVDALALEFTLKREGKIVTLDKLPNEKYQWRHDWAYTQYCLIDLKRRPSWSNNLCLSGTEKMKDSFNKNQLTHIVGFSQNIENNYKIGDILKFTYEGILPLRDAINNSQRTKKDYRLLSKNSLHLHENVL